MAGTPAGSEVADGHRGRRRTTKDTKLVETKPEDREGGWTELIKESQSLEMEKKVVNIHIYYHRKNSVSQG